MFFESIQQSPIDLELSSQSPPLLMMNSQVSEENPLSPPVETPLINMVGSRMKYWKSKEWIHQLLSPLQEEGRDGALVERCSDGISIEVRQGTSLIRVLGIQVFWSDVSARVFEEDKLDDWVRQLYLKGQGLIEKWRSRVVRLSLDTDEVECSLMDDLYPPRTFLAEYKLLPLLKSIRLHDGLLYISTPTRTITVPVSLLEDEPDGKVAELLCAAAPELSVIDINQVFEQFVELRRMCIDEDNRIVQQGHNARVESPELSTIDITVGGG